MNDQIDKDWIELIENPSNNQRSKDIYPKLKKWIETISPKHILEIGCGQGICSDQFHVPGSHSVGIDPSKILIDRANELYKANHRTFILGKAERLPFDHEIFDAAYSISVWHLLPDIQSAARELARVLKPDGHFYIITANPHAYSLWTEMYSHTTQTGIHFEGDLIRPNSKTLRESLYLHSYEDLIHSFESAHLEIQKTETFRSSLNHPDMDFYIGISGTRWVD